MNLPLPVFLPSIAMDPIHQFKIFPLIDWSAGGYNLAFTNSSFWMLVSTVLVLGFLGMAASRASLIPNRIQSLGEMSYTFISDMVRSTAGEEGLKFFPFVFTLFFFILGANIVGMFPYAFTTTSHIAVTGALALVVILIVVVYGIYKNGLGFFGLFAPHGVPLPVMFFLVPIEIISFLGRPITLGMRLFANMLRCLRPGGILVLQGYNPQQLVYKTGGPSIASHLYTPALLREAFTGTDILELREYEADLSEGPGHSGRSALIGMVARRR